MNGFWGWMNLALVERAGWALLHSVWQGGVAALIYAALRLALRRRSAQARYWAGCAVLFLLAVAPIVTAFSLRLPIGSGAPPDLSSDRSSPAREGSTRSTPPLTLALGSGGPAWASWCLDFTEGCLPWLVMAWLLGVAISGGRWVQGCWWVRRIRTVGTEPLEVIWIRRLSELKWRLGISRPVRLVKSALVEVPMVVGWLRPVILLPASALTGLTPAQLEAILAHELAHVRRYDYLVNSFQNLVETLMFYHPAVWWISRSIRDEREQCCDDLVVRVCRDRMVYARALFRLEELRGFPARLAFGAGGAALLPRIRRLLRSGPEPWPVGPKEFGGLALMALGCVLIFTGLYLMLGTRTFRSAVRVRVEPAASGESVPAVVAWARSYDPYAMQTAAAVINSEYVLRQAADSLNLREAWSKRAASNRKLSESEVLVLLQRRLNVRFIRNTTLLEILVSDEDPAEAAAIANQVAEAFQEYCLGQRRQAVEFRIRALDQRLAEQDARVRAARDRVETLRAELNVPSAVTVASSPQEEAESALHLNAETARRLEGLRIETQAELTRQQSLLEQLKQLPRDQVPQVIPTSGIQDSLLGSLLEQLALAEQKEIALVKDYGPSHLEVRKVVGQIDDLRQKIRDRTEGILLGLGAKVESMKQSLEQMKDQLDRLLQNDLQKAAQYRPYWEARRSLDDQERFRQALFMKVASERIEEEKPGTMQVEIVDQAIPPARPISPNRPRATALVLAGLLLNGLGLLMVRRSQTILTATAPKPL